MNNLHTENLIIGAGPAGLSCAMELSKAKKDFIVVEKDSIVGGLSKTYKFTAKDGSVFYTDNGPHRFFSKNQRLYDFIEEVIGEDWIKVHRQTRQLIDNKFYDYPVNPIQALRNIGILKASKMMLDYLWAKVVYKVFRKEVKTFEDYAVSNFGRSLAEFNIINYTEKIWGIPASEIHAEWALQRIKGLNVTSVLKNFIQRTFSGSKNSGPKSLVDEFYYPSKGTGEIYTTIAEKLKLRGYKVFTDTYPVSIKKVDKNFLVTLKSKDGEIQITCKNLIESIPITNYIKLLDDVPKEVLESAKKLRHRSQVYLFLMVNKDKITDDQWVYFPKKEIRIGRISEMKNFSREMSPKGKSSLFVEFFCFENDDLWNSKNENIFNLAIQELTEMGLLKKSEVIDYTVIRKENVYPIYDLEYKKYLAVVKAYLDKIDNLFYIGRPGRFRYNNQDHSLEMGMLTAQSIIDNQKYDIDLVGEEQEYFEKGKVPNKD